MTVADWTAGLSCVAAGIGAFLPWAKVAFISVSGAEGDGVIVVVVAAVALMLTAGFAARRKLWMAVLVTLCGIIIAFIALYYIGDIESLTDDSEGLVRVGEGLYLVLIAGIALTASAGVGIYRHRRASIVA
ncbi:hypothetical protein [Candidatus Poriferisocius sp.]|uniref:hypothetical protein n=1 Tax=Candidatus Poriferisocius sp. TaxID=3101276 RepID=UPI003B017E3D